MYDDAVAGDWLLDMLMYLRDRCAQTRISAATLR